MTFERGRMALLGFAVVAAAALLVSVAIITPAAMPLGSALLAAFPPSLLLGALALPARYPCRAMPLRTTAATRLVAAHAAAAAAVAGLWALTWTLSPGVIGRSTSFVFGTGMVLYLVVVTVHYLVLEIDRSRDAEQTALRYQVLAREAELKAFKAQVDPHFLFNSLNAVSALCGSRPAEARQMAQLMADFFRSTVRLGGQERITLREEIELVSRYLAIEKVRFGDRLDVHIDVDGAAGGAMVPPLLLQPLIENAVRHGVASMIDGGTVDVAASCVDGTLRIRIDNPVDPETPRSAGEGIGLQNAAGRLRAISGGKASLRTAESDGRFRVEIELPA